MTAAVSMRSPAPTIIVANGEPFDPRPASEKNDGALAATEYHQTNVASATTPSGTSASSASRTEHAQPALGEIEPAGRRDDCRGPARDRGHQQTTPYQHDEPVGPCLGVASRASDVVCPRNQAGGGKRGHRTDRDGAPDRSANRPPSPFAEELHEGRQDRRPGDEDERRADDGAGHDRGVGRSRHRARARRGGGVPMFGELGECAAADDQDGPGAQHEQRAAADLPGGVVGAGQAACPHPFVEPGADDGHPVVQGRLFVAVRVVEQGPELLRRSAAARTAGTSEGVG